MTETPTQSIVAEALAVVDAALARYAVRDVVPAGEVADLLLDLRSLLTSEDPATAGVGVAEPAAAGQLL